MTGMKQKDLQKIAARLRDDRLVIHYSQSEAKSGQQRPSSRVYYYIDYQLAVDSTKWRLYKTISKVEDSLRKDAHSQYYVCEACGQEFDILEVVALAVPSGFECSFCGNNLHQEVQSFSTNPSHEKLGQLMRQLEPIVSLLKIVDQGVVPSINFQEAMACMIPIDTDSSILENDTIKFDIHSESDINKYNIHVDLPDSNVTRREIASLSKVAQYNSDSNNKDVNRKGSNYAFSKEEDNAIASFYAALKENNSLDKSDSDSESESSQKRAVQLNEIQIQPDLKRQRRDLMVESKEDEDEDEFEDVD